MCVVSMVMKYYGDQWYPPSIPNYPWPPFAPAPTAPVPTPAPSPIIQPIYIPPNLPTKEQFEEFLELMRKAKDIDKATGQPDCELEEKKDIIRKLAEIVGVPLKKLEDIWDS